jgi:hypothetical protein
MRHVRFALVAVSCIALGVLGPRPAAAERLRLVVEAAPNGHVDIGVLKPFEAFMVAERDSAHTQLSAVAYTLQIPDGVVVLGEECLVESILGLGSSRAGMNLVFRCTDSRVLRVLRFRFVATRPLTNATIALRPDTRTSFLGVVSCRDENFDKFACPPDSLLITSH